MVMDVKIKSNEAFGLSVAESEAAPESGLCLSVGSRKLPLILISAPVAH